MSTRPRDVVATVVTSPATQRAARSLFLAVRKLEKRVLTPENRIKGGGSRPAAPDDPLKVEERKLKRSWASHAPEALDQYLVSGYQNPRINAQSILARHFFLRQLFGDEFDALMREEQGFGIELSEVLRRRAGELGVTMGHYLDPEKFAEVQRVQDAIADRQSTYESRWQEALSGREGGPISVLELACGSANDYRSMVDYGVARFLDYHGIDLNENNIANATSRFPDVDFRVGSVLELPFADSSVEFVLAFDIFEHLSLEAGHRALMEAVRVSSKGLVLSFFSMSDQPAHVEKPLRQYHWNVLSASQVQRELEPYFGSVEVVHVHPYLRREFGYAHNFNKRAWTFIATDPR